MSVLNICESPLLDNLGNGQDKNLLVDAGG